MEARPTLKDYLLSGRGQSDDAFRLAIKGFALIEDGVNDALADAFGGDLPDDLRRAPWRVRLAVTRALDLIPEELVDPLGRLARLRHDLAHAKQDDVGPSAAKQLVPALRKLHPPSAHVWEGAEPRTVLRMLLMAVAAWMNASIELAAEQREQQQMAMQELFRQSLRPVTDAEVDELLRHEKERRSEEEWR